MKDTFDFAGLRDRIEYAAKEAFLEIYNRNKDEMIYAFALYSDDGAMTVCPATNTLEHFESNDPDDMYYKFDPVEWKYEMQGADDLFNDISTICREEVLEKEEDEVWFENFQQQLYDTCIDVLEKLKKEDFFKQIVGEDIFLNFVVSEYEFPVEKMIDTVTRLNDNFYREEYIEWIRSWSE